MGRRWILVGALALGTIRAADIPIGLDAYMPVPDDNPITAPKIALGRRLFFDRRLSADGSVACATCHDPAKAFSDSTPTSTGAFARRGVRNAPALINRGYGAAFFWDGRAATLEEQVLGPIENPVELASSVDAAVAWLGRDATYVDEFRDVFGDGPTRVSLARALATFVRSIVSGASPVDRFLAGDRDALPADVRAGLRLFRGKGNCTACHIGPTFTDERFHNTGVAFARGAPADAGRAAVNGQAADTGAFKTPTLRHVSETAPYMHDGSVASLEEVVEHYDRGGTPNRFLDPEIRRLRLTPDEKRALIALLHALSGEIAVRSR